jgi:thiamine pyrophosphate-dependent acetolactate synthase large subunit-like protein
MAKLTKEQYLSKLQSLIGEDTSDDALAIVEDFTDTYNEMESAITNDGPNWEQKFKENDEAWRKKYRERFFSGQPQEEQHEEEQEEKEKTITIDDLFK